MSMPQVTEFDIDREYVGRVVGAQGSGINKLRDQLGVKVDVSDEADEKDKEWTNKKKKTTTVHQKSRVKVSNTCFHPSFLESNPLRRSLVVRKTLKRPRGASWLK
jgi:predicted PilT family ATPase